MIQYSLERAKELKRQFIRVERFEKLQALDIEFMKALEVNDTGKLADIAAKKTRLRDAPEDSSIASASTIEEVKAVRPSILDET
ncbi:hypothetical protein N9F73_00545 [bacterium]|nr:hypothetical protein [bacterium]